MAGQRTFEGQQREPRKRNQLLTQKPLRMQRRPSVTVKPTRTDETEDIQRKHFLPQNEDKLIFLCLRKANDPFCELLIIQ
ncbi:hypothetical protein Gasu2_20620 [Galdieria sulphuraria]|uniref:Uncharacterized protein n=1 Tax=Galdieria sulphuraria TaxID=130081 RepID=M2Y609_GALSU|nr:uncharacterized protein Gasu_15280 [Galdieria sulphuraria]EME31289.1 hypothetical protein Gasu_15280 [Galdieria sulphuraria]GJD07718.1 hypothetical protein Gasu2_20620 [Galdieria sulphuraria]|eukprot:XP_005707809.1 hypothetical protein Gasu_15280 [Galdieria sulphuraria]